MAVAIVLCLATGLLHVGGTPAHAGTGATYSTSAPAATPVVALRAPRSDYYRPITYRLTKKQVRHIYLTSLRLGTGCSWTSIGSSVLRALRRSLPVSVISVICSAAARSQENVFARAYWNRRGAICRYYIHKGITSLNYVRCSVRW